MFAWTLQHLVSAGTLAVVVAVICRFGRVGPVGRHALWLVVLVKLLTPPVVVLPTPWARTETLSTVTPETVATVETLATSARLASTPRVVLLQRSEIAPEPVGVAATTDVAALPAGRSTWEWRAIARAILPILAGVWLAGALLVFALVQILRVRRLRLHLRASSPAGRGFVAHVHALAERLAIRPPAIRIMRGINAPMIWCVNPFRPQLLWPAVLSSNLRGESLRALVVHELAHVKRRDHMVGWLELAAGCLWWWNPVFWRVRSRLRENAELACDGWVVAALPESRRAYAEALLAVCAGLRPAPAPMLAAGASTGSRQFLERRLVMIMKERVSLRVSRLGMLLLALLGVAAVPVWAQRVVTVAPQDVKPVTVKVKPIVDVTRVVDVAPKIVVADVAPVVIQDVSINFERSAQGTSIPPEAQKLIEKFNAAEAAARKEVEDKLAAERQNLIKELQAMQETFTKAGKLDEAVAIRDHIRRLENGRLVYRRDAIDSVPLNLHLTEPDARARDLYALLSQRVEVVPEHANADRFVAWTRRGEGQLQSLRNNPGATITMEVTGAQGDAWGTDVYTDDTPIAVAAVHAGILKVGEKGWVKITIMPGRDSYTASERNGIKSQSFGKFEGSYRIERGK